MWSDDAIPLFHCLTLWPGRALASSLGASATRRMGGAITLACCHVGDRITDGGTTRPGSSINMDMAAGSHGFVISALWLSLIHVPLLFSCPSQLSSDCRSSSGPCGPRLPASPLILPGLRPSPVLGLSESLTPSPSSSSSTTYSFGPSLCWMSQLDQSRLLDLVLFSFSAVIVRVGTETRPST